MACSVEVFDAVQAHVDPIHGGSWTRTPIAWPNETPSRADNEPWIAIDFTAAFYAQQTIGAGEVGENRWDEEGVLWGHVFVQLNSGARECFSIGKAFADLFRGALLMNGQLEFLEANLGAGEPADDDGIWYRMSVSIEYRAFEL